MPTSPPPVERHPLQPFLPEKSRLLMLGSFPPSRKRWSMDFFYPNVQNDMWRIFGLVFFDDKDHFYDTQEKRFLQHDIETFLNERGIALYDTATAVRRLRGNASDQFLEIVEPTDVAALLRAIPDCRTIATTGGKATEELCGHYGVDVPRTGESIWIADIGCQLFRMPSSSRSYPLSLNKKADAYRQLFSTLHML